MKRFAFACLCIPLSMISLSATSAEDFGGMVPKINRSLTPPAAITKFSSGWSNGSGTNLHARFDASTIQLSSMLTSPTIQSPVFEAIQIKPISFTNGLPTALPSNNSFSDSLLRSETTSSPLTLKVLQQLEAPAAIHSSLLQSGMSPSQIPIFAPATTYHGLR